MFTISEYCLSLYGQQFFETKAVGSAIEMPQMNMEKIFIRLAELSIEFPDGFILKHPVFEIVREGWVVKLKGFESLHGESGMQKAVEVAIKTSREIGGWRDGDLIFWDVVMIFEDEDVATEAGMDQDQMFIYQIETGRFKWLY